MTALNTSIPATSTATTLTYRLAPEPGAGSQSALRLTWRVDGSSADFPGFALVAGQSAVPTRLSDSLELHRWTPHGSGQPASQGIVVNLAAIREQSWKSFYCKLILLDSSDQKTLVIHPDTCRVYYTDGRDAEVRRIPPPLRYEPGTPRTLICPKCFEEFPVEKMLFAYEPNGDAVPVHYSWLQRLRGIKRIIPPRDAKGRRAAFRFCPNKHAIPFSAGTQSSLIIGLIGAQYSGKTHYVASLVHTLFGQAGADNNIGMLPADEGTKARYIVDFQKPLFEDRAQLPVTVGQPPPLIYDLSFPAPVEPAPAGRAGAGADRKVTLALYDTAGENLQDPTRAEQMCRYVRVAAGLMLLIDPFQIEAVRQLLPSSGLPAPVPDATPAGILENILGSLHQHKVVTESGPLPIPIAVVLTKCDALRQHGLLGHTRLWHSRENRHIGGFNSTWHQDMSGMIGERLQKWTPAAYGTIVTKFPNHAFFGASATGHAPNAYGRFSRVEPFRVEDPLLWLLSVVGVFPSKELK